MRLTLSRFKRRLRQILEENIPRRPEGLVPDANWETHPKGELVCGDATTVEHVIVGSGCRVVVGKNSVVRRCVFNANCVIGENCIVENFIDEQRESSEARSIEIGSNCTVLYCTSICGSSIRIGDNSIVWGLYVQSSVSLSLGECSCVLTSKIAAHRSVSLGKNTSQVVSYVDAHICGKDNFTCAEYGTLLSPAQLGALLHPAQFCVLRWLPCGNLCSISVVNHTVQLGNDVTLLGNFRSTRKIAFADNACLIAGSNLSADGESLAIGENSVLVICSPNRYAFQQKVSLSIGKNAVVIQDGVRAVAVYKQLTRLSVVVASGKSVQLGDGI